MFFTSRTYGFICKPFCFFMVISGGIFAFVELGFVAFQEEVG